MSRGEQLRRLAVRRPGPAGLALLPLTWVVLGLLLVAYLVAIMVFAFAAVLVATLRLFLTPVLTPVLRLLARLPGVRQVRARRATTAYARDGVAELERRLATTRPVRPSAQTVEQVPGAE